MTIILTYIFKKCDYNHIMKNILDLLKPEEIKEIKYVSLEKEQILFNENDTCEHVSIVIKGEIEIVSYAFNGKEIVYNQLSEGMIFGNNLLFSSDPHYKGAVIAKKASKVALISKKSLLTLLKSNEEFAINYLRYQSDMGKELNEKIKLLSLSNAEERLLYFLYQRGGSYRFKNVTQFAKRIFLQRETLSRLLTKLEKEQRITRKNNLVTVR